MSAISCRQLRKSFGDFEVLRGIDLEVERGELFGFLGPNGAGKTTTIRILTGILQPSAGKVEILGQDVVERPLEVKRRVGYVPDRAYLYPKLTAREFLEFVGHLYRLDAGEVERVSSRLLERFDLAEWVDELIESYSHGMRQKLAVTAALIHDPEIIVIDEPMIGLDPRSARVMKTLLAELVDSGKTVFLSTHTLQVAEELCSRVAIVQKGLIVARGTLDELRRLAMADHGSLEAVFLRLTQDDEPVAVDDLQERRARKAVH
ncbi:MAG TPA: ABC transporter ATP-binding protein [Gemmatimonadota bacterium]|nr:ABC transporter ATP-binding protein [Gemmatimonadota bacterium]